MPVTPTCEGLEPRRLFAAALVHQELHRPPSGLLRDFNGDGLDDLAVVTAPSRGADGIGVDILLNDGKGAFVLVGHTDCDDGDPSADVFAADITLGDVNGDGAPDIVAKLLSTEAGSGDAKATAAVMLNTGKGEFTRGKAMSVLHRLTRGRAHSIVGDDLGFGVADLDGDKFGDIVSVYGDEISITMMSERGPRQTTSFQVSEVTVQGWDPKSKKEFIGLGDLTGDGRADLVASSDDHGIYIMEWDFDYEGSPTIGNVGTVEGLTIKPNTRVLLSDDDGDGKNDDLIVLQNRQLFVGVNDSEKGGGFTFRELGKLPGGVNPDEILIGDVDGDGDDELFTLRWQANGIGHTLIIK